MKDEAKGMPTCVWIHQHLERAMASLSGQAPGSL